MQQCTHIAYKMCQGRNTENKENQPYPTPNTPEGKSISLLTRNGKFTYTTAYLKNHFKIK